MEIVILIAYFWKLSDGWCYKVFENIMLLAVIISKMERSIKFWNMVQIVQISMSTFWQISESLRTDLF